MKTHIPRLLLLLWLPVTCLASDQEVVQIKVAGLACPFCVFSLEKNLAKLDNIESVEVDLAGASARIVISEGGKADIDAIKQAIMDAGFTPGEVTQSIAGQ